MRAYDVIYKKRNGGRLTREEIEFFVGGVTRGAIHDDQAAAFLMAAFLKGLDSLETACLTRAMTDSGEQMDLSSVQGVKVDKHSTGGVGDGISLVLAPLAAVCGVAVPMMSGRGLAHTGGTLDKLESIPRFRVDLTASECVEQLKKIGVAMLGQTPNIAPADKKLYALRDVTATVDHVSLITASILSKKLAEGADALVLDVKTGSGAFMRQKKDAVLLAKTMVGIGKRCKRRVVALVTDMDQPLGMAVGNALEMAQAVEILRGKETPGTQSYIELTELLGGWMLYLGKKARSPKDGQTQIRAARKDGRGLAKFRELVKAQGGDERVCDDPWTVLPRASKTKDVLSPWKGRVGSMDARAVGIASMLLGAGRETQDSRIDPAAGIVLHKRVGDAVERGEPLAQLHFSDGARVDESEKTFLAAVRIGKTKPRAMPLIHQIIR